MAYTLNGRSATPYINGARATVRLNGAIVYQPTTTQTVAATQTVTATPTVEEPKGQNMK